MADVAVPPLDRMFLVGIWLETALYGINCLVFASALFVISRMRRAGKGATRFLIITSVWLFGLSTAYVGVCLRQLLEAFIFGPPGQASLYFANVPAPLSVTKLSLYEVNVTSQDIVLIWRLWVVYGRNWKVIVVPILLECAHIGTGIFTIRRGAEPNVAVFDPTVHRGAIAYWTTDLVLNIGVTLAIAYKLYLAGKSVAGLGTRDKHPYLGVIFTIIESGGIFAAATLITVCMYLSGSIATVAAIDVVVQLATITPLLIVVRVGFGLTHGATLPTISKYTSHGISSMGNGLRTQPVHVTISETRDTFGDNSYAMEGMAIKE